jgi:magnesium transporter
MLGFKKKSSHKIGLPPGSFHYIGSHRTEPVTISTFRYGHNFFEEKNNLSLDEALIELPQGQFLWVNFIGIHEIVSVERICNFYNIHPLTIEDILSTEQRPKLEENEDYIYLVVKMLEFQENLRKFHVEQVSMILGKNMVISFQEKEGDTFDAVRNRLRSGKGRIQKAGSDYLLYTLVDTIIDNYFILLEKMGDVIEEVEEDLLLGPGESTLTQLYNLKRDTVVLRRSIWPLREVVHKLERDDMKLIKKETRLYLRDVYDHTIRIIETIENFRDMLSSMVDLYQSTLSNRMNVVMKVLTIISTIFIPLTFIAGIYGMNFEYMPELGWKYGYLGVWIIMITVVFIMLFFFRKKKWI